MDHPVGPVRGTGGMIVLRCRPVDGAPVLVVLVIAGSSGFGLWLFGPSPLVSADTPPVVILRISGLRQLITTVTVGIHPARRVNGVRLSGCSGLPDPNWR